MPTNDMSAKRCRVTDPSSDATAVVGDGDGVAPEGRILSDYPAVSEIIRQARRDRKGIVGPQQQAVSAARRSIATFEKIVDDMAHVTHEVAA